MAGVAGRDPDAVVSGQPRPTSGSRSAVVPKIPAQRCVDPRPLAEQLGDEPLERSPGSAAWSPPRPCTRARAPCRGSRRRRAGRPASAASSRSRAGRSAGSGNRRRSSGSVTSTWPRVGLIARVELGHERRACSRRSRSRPGRRRARRATRPRSCSRSSAPASAASAASRRTQRAGWSDPSGGWKIAPSKRPAERRSGARRATRPRSRPRAAPRTRPRAPSRSASSAARRRLPVAPEGVAGQLLEPVERSARSAPRSARARSRAELAPRDVVGGRAAAEREAAVAPARPAGDLARLVAGARACPPRRA